MRSTKCHRPGRAAFTLIEIMIVVAVIGLLAAIALPSIARARETTRATLMFTDMKTAASAFEMFAMENPSYPPSAAPGVVPIGMSPYLGSLKWTEPSPLGGSWDWDFNSSGFVAAVSVLGHKGTSEAMQELDARLDDGNLDTGIFRGRPNGNSYVIE